MPILGRSAFDDPALMISNGPVTTLNSGLVIKGAGDTGTFVANGATPVTVADPSYGANSTVLITLKTVGGTVGALPRLVTSTPGTGFNVAASASDTSTYKYQIIG